MITQQLDFWSYFIIKGVGTSDKSQGFYGNCRSQNEKSRFGTPPKLIQRQCDWWKVDFDVIFYPLSAKMTASKHANQWYA